MFCKECQRSVYEDDALAFVEAADGRRFTGCRDCRAAARGEEQAARPVYPVGLPVPAAGEGEGRRDILICACCRRALRSGERQQAMRLLQEDVELELNPPPVGALLSCPECVERWRPVILERLQAAGIVVSEMTEEMLL